MGDEVKFEDPRAVMKRHGIRAKKSWGQNFLVSQGAVSKITGACVDVVGRHVIEIGPGLGTLTGALLSAGAVVSAVERDRDMCDVLRKEFGQHPNLTLYEADAAEFDYAACLGGNPGVVAGNLPYQITGRIMRRIVECEADIIAAIFMVQEEVAQRLCASTVDKARGALSVMVQARCEPAVLLRLPPTAFHPRPSVRSAVIRLVPRQQKLLPPGGGPMFDATVKAAFVTRRKTVRNSMLAAKFAPAATIDDILARAQVNPGMRAEKIELAQFLRMAAVAAETKE